MPTTKLSRIWMLPALLLSLSLTGCASLCAPSASTPVVVQESRPPKIDPRLMEPEKATYLEAVQRDLSSWRQKLTGSQ